MKYRLHNHQFGVEPMTHGSYVAMDDPRESRYSGAPFYAVEQWMSVRLGRIGHRNASPSPVLCGELRFVRFCCENRMKRGFAVVHSLTVFHMTERRQS